MDLFSKLVIVCYLALVVFMFLRSFLSKDPGKKSISVALFGYIYSGTSSYAQDNYDYMLFVACVAFSAIYILVLTGRRLLKAMGLRKSNS